MDFYKKFFTVHICSFILFTILFHFLIIFIPHTTCIHSYIIYLYIVSSCSNYIWYTALTRYPHNSRYVGHSSQQKGVNAKWKKKREFNYIIHTYKYTLHPPSTYSVSNFRRDRSPYKHPDDKPPQFSYTVFLFILTQVHMWTIIWS